MRRRLGRRAVGAVVLLAACGVAVSADARPDGLAGGAPASRIAAAAPADTVAAPAAGARYGIPPLPVYESAAPNDVKQPYVGRVGSAAATTARSKVTVAVRDAVMFAHIKACLVLPLGGGLTIQTCCPDPIDTSTCPKDDIEHPPATSADDLGSVTWTGATGQVWVSSPRGAPLRYGTFPPTRVRLLAFGSVPVTATVHLTQPKGRGGTVAPLTLRLVAESSLLPAGTRIEGYPVPAPAADLAFVQTVTLSGVVDVRISDVAVDGVPLRVGDRCHTATPARLAGADPTGFFANDADPDSLVGRPGGFQPLNATQDGANRTGRLAANLAIPAFTGCRDGARSLDPLMTALASGSRNPVTLRLATAFYQCDNPYRPLDCPAYPVKRMQPATQPAQRTSLRHAASADLPLTAAQRDRLRRAVRGLPPAVRRNAVESMSPALARLVTGGTR